MTSPSLPKQTVLRNTVQWVCDQLPSELAQTLPAGEELVEPLWLYWKLLQQWNAKIRLTGANTLEEYAHRHIADSLVGWWGVADTPTAATWLDVGAGAGFPSIPLALLRSDLCWIAIESHSRRAAFLQKVKRDLALNAYRVRSCRVSGDPDREKLPSQSDGMVFRAVAPEQILPLAARYVAEQGRVLYWGTPDMDLPSVPTLTDLQTFPYTLPGGESFCLYRWTVCTSEAKDV